MNHSVARHPLYWLPNAISFSRLVLVLPYSWMLSRHLHSPYTLALLALIILSDKIDGTLARKFKSESQMGDALDATADMGYQLASWIIFLSTGIINLPLFLFLIFSRIFQGLFLVFLKFKFGKWNTGHYYWSKFGGVLQSLAIIWILVEAPYGIQAVFISAIIAYIGIAFSEIQRYKLTASS